MGASGTRQVSERSGGADAFGRGDEGGGVVLAVRQAEMAGARCRELVGAADGDAHAAARALEGEGGLVDTDGEVHPERDATTGRGGGERRGVLGEGVDEGVAPFGEGGAAA